MTSTTLTIEQLELSPFNVRTNQTDTQPSAALEKSILAVGLIHALRVHPMRGRKNKWGVHAGGRRYRSIKALIARGDLPADWPVAVMISEGTEAELIEESIAENGPRRDLRPYEVFLGVAKANRRGHDVRKIADALGQESDWVRQSIRLGSLAKPVFEALERGEIGVDQARAYGATEDLVLQEAAFEALHRLPPHLREPRQIRAWLKVGDAELERLLRFVGHEAYRAAGGRYELDLFADFEGDRGAVRDEDKLRALSELRLSATKTDIRRRTGRPDLRFIAAPPQGEFNITDWILQVTPEAGPDNTIVLPAGAIVAQIELVDTMEGTVGPMIAYWWESRKAKYGSEKAEIPKLPTTKVGAALTTSESFGGEPARRAADAAIKQQEGIGQETIDILRSVRRFAMRAALVEDARDRGTVATDFLVWSQLRLLLDQRATIHTVGIGKIGGASTGPMGAHSFLEAMPATKTMSYAVFELTQQTFITGDDLGEAFLDYRASADTMKQLAAAVVTGLALERSLNAADYRLPVHEALAAQLDLDSEEGFRRHWTPTADLLDRIPRDQRLAIAEPFVERAAFAGWSRLKSTELTRSVLSVVTGSAEWLRDAVRVQASSWVHPLLRFGAPPAEADEQTRQISEAAE